MNMDIRSEELITWIARILGIAEATVSWRMHEIRRQLAPKAGTED